MQTDALAEEQKLATLTTTLKQLEMTNNTLPLAIGKVEEKKKKIEAEVEAKKKGM